MFEKEFIAKFLNKAWIVNYNRLKNGKLCIYRETELTFRQ